MLKKTLWSDQVTLPALLRSARRAYGAAIGDAQAKAGCDDIPRNGSFVIGAIARTGAPLSQVIEALGLSKQAAGYLVDTLVVRGYLERSVDPLDRRRLSVSLTDRGRVAAAATRRAVDALDAKLAKRVGVDYIAHTRATLCALIEEYHDLGKSTLRAGAAGD
jgi:DNA-binding MarR family transcriptional regulator